MRAAAVPAADPKPRSIATAASAASVIIVGAGPVGLTVALRLAAHGFSCVLVESQAPEATRADRRLLALSRGTLDILRPLLADELPMAPIGDVWVSSAGEFGATHLSALDFDGAALGATVYYGDLVQALTAAADAQPQIAWRRPARIAAIEQTPSGVVVRLDQGEALRACCVIHAEGRADSGLPRAQGPAAIIAEIQLAGPAADAAFERFTRAGPLALLPAPAPAGAPAWGLVWCVEDETAAHRCAALGDAEFVRHLQAQLGLRRARVVQAGRRRVVLLPAQARARVHAFRQVWLGNAAQTLHPVAGQGFNLGVRDVAVLGECLAAARAGRATPADAPATIPEAAGDEQFCAGVPAALARYAQRRVRDRAAIGSVTRWLPAVFASRLAPLVAARGAALGALDLLPPLRRQWAHLLMFGVRS